MEIFSLAEYRLVLLFRPRDALAPFLHGLEATIPHISVGAALPFFTSVPAPSSSILGVWRRWLQIPRASLQTTPLQCSAGAGFGRPG
jgi:hypothetical protein